MENLILNKYQDIAISDNVTLVKIYYSLNYSFSNFNGKGIVSI